MDRYRYSGFWFTEYLDLAASNRALSALITKTRCAGGMSLGVSNNFTRHLWNLYFSIVLEFGVITNTVLSKQFKIEHVEFSLERVKTAPISQLEVTLDGTLVK